MDGEKTPDYEYDFIKDTLEHKGVGSNEHPYFTKNTISHAIENAKGQSRNVLIDISKSKMTLAEGIIYVKRAYSNPSHYW